MIFYSVLFLIYFLALIGLNKKNKFFIQSGLSPKTINILFSIKVAMGLLYIYFDTCGINGNDLQYYFARSQSVNNLLLQHPLQFFTSAFDISDSYKWSKLFYTHSFWDIFRNVFLIKLIAVLNIFSFKNLYINSLIFNYLIFYGHIALYRAFSKVWTNKTMGKIVGCFLVPSSLYYLSGINKDSLFFLGMGLVIYAISHRGVGKTFNNRLLLGLGLVLTFIIRNFFFLLFIPTFIAYALSQKTKLNALLIFCTLFFISTVVFFCSPFLMQLVCQRQADFLQLGYAKSALKVQILQPHFSSFISHLPSALNIGFLRPYVWDSYTVFYFASAVEVLLVLALVIIALVYSIKDKIKTFVHPLVLFCIFYGFFAFLFIGYTIPILGAATRYRTAFLPLLITPLLCVLPYQKLTHKKHWFKLNS